MITRIFNIKAPLVALIILSACNPQKNTNTKDAPLKSEFLSYVNTLDQIPLPFKHNTLAHFPDDLSQTFDNSGFKNYKHTWASYPLGILYQNSESVGIIDCSIGDWGQVPLLTTYDLDGNKIDSTNFYYKSGSDIGYEAMEYLTLHQNKTITVIDSVKRWELKNAGADIIEGSLKITSRKVEYRISEKGKINKLSKN